MKLRFSSVIRLSAISFIALGLAACSSGSGVPLDAGVGGGGGGSGGGMGNSSGKTSDIPAAGESSKSSLEKVAPDLKDDVAKAKTEESKKVYDRIEKQLLNEEYPENEISNFTYKKNGVLIDNGTQLSRADIPSEGLHFDKERIEFSDTIIERTIRLYDLPYSQIAGYVNHSVKKDGNRVRDKEGKLNLTFSNIYGKESQEYPQRVVASYKGKAFNAAKDDAGELAYTVDFYDMVGSGNITKLDIEGGSNDRIQLDTAKIQSFNIGNKKVIGVNPSEGRAALDGNGDSQDKKGYYGFVFYGPNVDEIMGAVYDVKPDNLEKTNAIVGFGGKKESANSR